MSDVFELASQCGDCRGWALPLQRINRPGGPSTLVYECRCGRWWPVAVGVIAGALEIGLIDRTGYEQRLDRIYATTLEVMTQANDRGCRHPAPKVWPLRTRRRS